MNSIQNIFTNHNNARLPQSYPFSLRNRVFRKFMFLNLFSKSYDMIPKSKFNPIQLMFPKVQKAQIRLITSKESVWNHSDRPPQPGTPKTGCSVTGQLALERYFLPGELHRNRSPCSRCSLSGTHHFQPQNPNFDLIDPKFNPKTYTLD